MTDYSRGDYADLPAGKTDLENNYTAPDLTAIASNDNSTYANQTANNEIAIHQYKKTVTGQYINITWSGKSSLAPSESPVIMEVYNVTGTPAWEELDRDDSTAADTDFDITYNNLATADYLDSGVITWRVYQEASAASVFTYVGYATVGPGVVNANVVRTTTAVYAITGNDGSSLGVYKSTDGGANWGSELDSANHPALSVIRLAAKIDANGLIHILFRSGTLTIKYCTFNTATDAWVITTPETVATSASEVSSYMGIDVDSNNYPHAAWLDRNDFMVYYSNRITGSAWKTAVQVSQATSAYSTDIVVGASDIPIIAYCGRGGSPNYAYVAVNGTDPTTFVSCEYSTGMTTSGIMRISMVVDSEGNCIVCKSAGDGGSAAALAIVKHLQADAWGTWQTPETVDANAYWRSATMAVNGTNLYIFTENQNAPISLVCWNNVSGWAQTSLVVNDNVVWPNVRWSYRNNLSYETYGIQFVFIHPDDTNYTACGRATIS